MLLRTISFPPCRTSDLFAPLEKHPQELRRSLANEVYWLRYDPHLFCGDATIRIARSGNEALATRRCRALMRRDDRVVHIPITSADWALVEDAVVVADFWRLDQTIQNLGGLDGADWAIAGRRRADFHHIRRWSPHGPIYDLGRLMFDLAGLDNLSL